jgi:methionyl aminopeptidase
VLTALVAHADVGVNLLELDELAHQMIRDRGAESCYINYHPSFGASPFGKVLCTRSTMRYCMDCRMTTSSAMVT